MTVPVETSEVSYVGNGATTVFATGFVFQTADQLVVATQVDQTVAEVVQVLGVDYTVSGGAGAVGSVTMTVAVPNGHTLYIRRTVLVVQPTSFRTQGSFSPAVHEDQFDRLVYIDQQLDRRVKALESAGAPGSVVAGNGLSFSGTTLHAGGINGLVSGADALEPDYGTAGAIATVTRAAASAGTTAKVARIDHKHDVATAAPSSTAVQAGNASVSEGTSTSLARADHVHRVATAAPVNVTKATAAEGTSNSLARADHKHDVTTAAATEITDSTNAEGVATSLARSDHQHAHGTRGGGTLHAEATTSVAGFMSAADKTKLDGLLAGATPADVTKAAAVVGVSLALAKADHKHDVATAAAIAITDSTSAEGSSSSLARADHQHAHGDRAGGSLHAVVTTSVAGFMAAADKVRFDGMTAGNAPVNVTKSANNSGSSTAYAREDHKHDVSTAAPVAVTKAAAAEGTSTSLARADHKHDVTTDVPVSVTKATAAEGTSTALARADHKHDVTTAAAVTLTAATNAEGTSTALARADHQHAHGNLTGGSLHSVATPSEAGFLSSTDKAKLDGIVETRQSGTVQTTDATVTTILQWTPADGTAETVEISVVAKRKNSVQAGGYRAYATVTRQGGTTSQVGTTTVVAAHESESQWDVAVAVASPNVSVTVKGLSDSTIDWRCEVKRLVS